MAKKLPKPPCKKKRWKGSCVGCSTIWYFAKAECPLHPDFFRLIKNPLPKKISKEDFEKQKKRNKGYVIITYKPSEEEVQEIPITRGIIIHVRKGESWYLGKDRQGYKTYLIRD